jgi:hypothetical protein
VSPHAGFWGFYLYCVPTSSNQITPRHQLTPPTMYGPQHVLLPRRSTCEI